MSLEYPLGLTNQSTSKVVSIFEGQCDKCKVCERVVISTDATHSQYDSIHLCLPCISEMHDEYFKTRLLNFLV